MLTHQRDQLRTQLRRVAAIALRARKHRDSAAKGDDVVPFHCRDPATSGSARQERRGEDVRKNISTLHGARTERGVAMKRLTLREPVQATTAHSITFDFDQREMIAHIVLDYGAYIAHVAETHPSHGDPNTDALRLVWRVLEIG